MRVLVTGITGQVGSHLIASQAPPGVTWLPADRARLNLSEPEAIRGRAGPGWAPDLVVNCAAFTAVDRAEAEPDLADRINHRGASRTGAGGSAPHPPVH